MEATLKSTPINKVPEEEKEVEKVLIICARGTLEDVYAALIMANGALMEGKEAKMFFTFFGLDAITKSKSDHLHTSTVGNPAFMRSMPTMIGGLPGFEALASHMMKKEMDKLDIPPVSEFLEMIEAGGGEIYACKLAADMFHISKDDLADEVNSIITVGQMYDLAKGDGVQIIYV